MERTQTSGIASVRAHGPATAAPSPLGAPGVDRGRSAPPRKVDPLTIFLSALVLISISRIHQHISPLSAIRPALLFTALSLGYVVINPRSVSWPIVLKTLPGRLVLGLAVCALGSVLFGFSIGAAGSFFMADYSRVLVLAGLLIAASASILRIRWFLWAYVLSCGIWALLGVTVFDLTQAAGSYAYRLSGTYMFDANDLTLLMVVGIPLGVFLVETASRPPLKLLAAGCLVGMGTTIALAGSRGGMLALVAMFLTLLASVRHISVQRRVGVVLAVLALMAIAAPQGYWRQMETILSPQQDYNWTSDTGRKAIATRGFGYMLENPVFGVGVGNFARYEAYSQTSQRNYIPGEGVRWIAPHNSHLQVGAEMGVPALLMWMGLLGIGTVGMWRTRKRLPERWRQGTIEQRTIYGLVSYLPATFVGFAVASTFVSFAYLVPIYLLTACVAGLQVLIPQVLANEAAVAVPGRARASQGAIQAPSPVARPMVPVVPVARPSLPLPPSAIGRRDSIPG